MDNNKIFPDKINSLTSLRFIMIIMIAVSHLEFFKSPDPLQGNIYDMYFHNAGIAVNFFFILSGFGLNHSSFIKQEDPLGGKWSLAAGYQYARKKIKKIWKIYLLTTFIMFSFEMVKILNTDKSLIYEIVKKIAKLLLNLTLLQSATGFTQFSYAYNGVGWFLSCLFIFYMVYPLLFRLNSLLKDNKKQIKLAIVFTVTLYSIFYILFVHIDNILPDGACFSYVSPYIRIFPFFLGILLSDLYIYHKLSLKKQNYNFMEVFVLIITVLFYLFRNAVFFGQYEPIKNFLDMLLAAIIVYIYAFESGNVSKFLLNTKIIALGNLSMFIFLIHYPITIIMWSVLSELFGESIYVKMITAFSIILGTSAAVIVLRYISAKSQNNT